MSLTSLLSKNPKELLTHMYFCKFINQTFRQNPTPQSISAAFWAEFILFAQSSALCVHFFFVWTTVSLISFSLFVQLFYTQSFDIWATLTIEALSLSYTNYRGVVRARVGIAQWLVCLTCDWKVPGWVPTGAAEQFSSGVNFLCSYFDFSSTPTLPQ